MQDETNNGIDLIIKRTGETNRKRKYLARSTGREDETVSMFDLNATIHPNTHTILEKLLSNLEQKGAEFFDQRTIYAQSDSRQFFNKGLLVLHKGLLVLHGGEHWTARFYMPLNVSQQKMQEAVRSALEDTKGIKSIDIPGLKQTFVSGSYSPSVPATSPNDQALPQETIKEDKNLKPKIDVLEAIASLGTEGANNDVMQLLDDQKNLLRHCIDERKTALLLARLKEENLALGRRELLAVGSSNRHIVVEIASQGLLKEIMQPEQWAGKVAELGEVWRAVPEEFRAQLNDNGQPWIIKLVQQANILTTSHKSSLSARGG